MNNNELPLAVVAVVGGKGCSHFFSFRLSFVIGVTLVKRYNENNLGTKRIP